MKNYNITSEDWQNYDWDEDITTPTIKPDSVVNRARVLRIRNQSTEMKEATRKRNKTDKFRETIRKSRMGKKHSENARQNISRAKKGQTRSKESIQKQVEKMIDESAFDIGMNHLIIYEKKFKSLMVPAKYTTECGYNLGMWVAGQRKLYDKQKLLSHRVSKLNSIGFVWDVKQYQWDIAYEHLVSYNRKYKNCSVPQRYITECGYKLGMWVNNERKKQKMYKTNSKKYSNRIELLNKICFVW